MSVHQSVSRDDGREGSPQHALHPLSPLTTPSLGSLFADYDDSFPGVASMFEADAPETVQDPGTPSTDRDIRLLGFSPPLQRYDLLDSDNQKATISLSAQLHGMFFLAESPWPSTTTSQLSSDGLTCYRRNLFEVTGTIALPKSLRNIVTDQVGRSEIIEQELVINATESFDGNSVILISVPWKKSTDPIQTRRGDDLDRKPPVIRLRSTSADEGDSGVTNTPFHWKRLQFRNATANNGRRKELQQHFVVHIKVLACLADGSKIPICEAKSGGITVRGRSPRNFQARNDRPLHEQNKKSSHAPTVDMTEKSTRKNGGLDSTTSMPDHQTEDPRQELQAEPQLSTDPLDSFLRNDLFDWFGMSNLYSGSSTVLPLQENLPGVTDAIAEAEPQDRSNDRQYLFSRQSISRDRADPEDIVQGQAIAPELLSLPEPSALAAGDSSPAESPSNVVSNHLLKSPKRPFTPRHQSCDSDSSEEDVELSYEYFPLGLDDWLPPIDAVYRPHAVHHTDGSTDLGDRAREGCMDTGTNKRYFSELRT